MLLTYTFFAQWQTPQHARKIDYPRHLAYKLKPSADLNLLFGVLTVCCYLIVNTYLLYDCITVCWPRYNQHVSCCYARLQTPAIVEKIRRREITCQMAVRS